MLLLIITVMWKWMCHKAKAKPNFANFCIFKIVWLYKVMGFDSRNSVTEKGSKMSHYYHPKHLDTHISSLI